MNPFDRSKHPRGRLGRFIEKYRAEPDGDGFTVESRPTKGDNGSVHWLTRDGKRHRVDGPAVIWANGGEDWRQHGLLHRVGGPARTEPGYEEWWQDGKRHREDGPAFTYPDGTQVWWQHNRMHRDNGPAVTHPDGSLEWWVNDERKPPEIEAALTMMWLSRTPEGA